MTSNDLVERGMRIFRTIADRNTRGVCAQRISRFRGWEADYCPSPVVRKGAMYCAPHDMLAEAQARRIDAEVEAEMAEERRRRPAADAPAP
jgi:hypothetical protein